MRRFFGRKGYYAALITAMIILYGGALIYYQLLTQTLFPVIIGIKDIISGEYTPYVKTEADFSEFSLAWTSIIIFIPLYLVVSLRDRTIFIRVATYGVIFIIVQILFVIYFFIYSLTNTSYDFSIYEQRAPTPEVSNITLFNTNFQALTGMLAAGYYLHQLGLPIILDNEKQKNNSRDVF